MCSVVSKCIVSLVSSFQVSLKIFLQPLMLGSLIPEQKNLVEISYLGLSLSSSACSPIVGLCFCFHLLQEVASPFMTKQDTDP